MAATTTTQELEELLEKAALGGWATQREVLKHIRQHKTRRSDVVVDIGQKVLASPGGLGDEVWTVYEQVCVAAIDCHKYALAESCLDKLQNRFQSSRRVRRLEGLLAEARRDWSRAEQVYKDILADDPTSAVARKRQACIARQKGNVGEAIKLINAYLDDQCGDQSAWLELGNLYAQNHRYKQALFCYEELIMLNSTNYQVIRTPAPAVSNEGPSSPLLALVPPFLGPGFRLAARWNRLVETVKTRKKREKTGKKW
eukprot:COSAG04_NODE_4262_length_2200_cov_2.258448_1_plen_255_part_10